MVTLWLRLKLNLLAFYGLILLHMFSVDIKDYSCGKALLFELRPDLKKRFDYHKSIVAKCDVLYKTIEERRKKNEYCKKSKN